MKIRANAKINLFLDITGKRTDGYHNIETVFQEINLYDEIDINLNSGGFSLRCNIKELEGEDNLLKIAYDKMSKYFKDNIGVDVYLDKQIPFGAGLGGGSSDCARFMSVLKDISKADISNEELISLGASLGADVPFFFYGGTCIGKGIGDELETIDKAFSLNLLIVNPGIHVSTKEAYQGCRIKGANSNLQEIIKGFESGDLVRIVSNLYNGFEETVFKKYPEVKDCKEQIRSRGALGSLMSGSGSTCFGIFEDMNRAKQAEEYFINEKKYFACAVETIVR